jgi:hypothetical protein
MAVLGVLMADLTLKPGKGLGELTLEELAELQILEIPKKEVHFQKEAKMEVVEGY